MTAADIKKELLFYFLYRRNFLCAATEMAIYNGNIADVYAISESREAYEVEVKCAWGDFMSEVKAIKAIQSSGSLFYSAGSKHTKHLSFL